VKALPPLAAALAAALALAGCGRTEAPDPAAAARESAAAANESAAREDREHKASVARRDASYKAAGERARAAAAGDVRDSDAREARRVENQH
jgi:hypothetical protein